MIQLADGGVKEVKAEDGTVYKLRYITESEKQTRWWEINNRRVERYRKAVEQVKAENTKLNSEDKKDSDVISNLAFEIISNDWKTDPGSKIKDMDTLIDIFVASWVGVRAFDESKPPSQQLLYGEKQELYGIVDEHSRELMGIAVNELKN